MFETILLAKKSIYLEMYIFQDDMIDFNFLKLLKQKAQDGLKVKVILDSFGSLGLSKKVIFELKETGVELLFLSYFVYRTHRKILIVDEKIAFIGGVNLHQSSSLWNDLMVQVEGKLVSFIMKSFSKVYAQCGGKDIVVLSHNKAIFKKKMNDWLIEHFPVKNKFILKKIYIKRILKARKNIMLVTPYLVPKRWFIGALHQAHLRGVNIDILVPKNTDHYFIDRINYFFIKKLSKLGVNFYIEKQMNHAKIMVIDDADAIVGSNNLDFLSFEFNSEVGIFFQNTKAIHSILHIIKKWKNDAIIYNSKNYKREWFDFILYPIISLFYKIL